MALVTKAKWTYPARTTENTRLPESVTWAEVCARWCPAGS